MELLTTWEKNIEKNADELINLIFPTYEEIALNLKTQISKLDKEYQKLTTVVSKQREKKCTAGLTTLLTKWKRKSAV